MSETTNKCCEKCKRVITDFSKESFPVECTNPNCPCHLPLTDIEIVIKEIEVHFEESGRTLDRADILIFESLLTTLKAQVERETRERCVQFLKGNSEQAVEGLWYVHKSHFDALTSNK